MTETEIDNAREIFKAARKSYMDSIDEKLNEIVEMIQGREAMEKIWLDNPPPDLQSLVHTIRMYRPAPALIALVMPAPMSQV